MTHSSNRFRRLLMVCAVALGAAPLAGGCDSDADSVASDPDGGAETGVAADTGSRVTDSATTTDSAVSTTTVTKSIGASGGSVSLDGIALTIPAGAVSSDRAITITKTSDSVAGYVLYSPVYRFEPEGITFAKPVDVEITFTSGSASPSLFWSRTDGSGYDDVAGTVTGNKVKGSVTHFSTGFVGRAVDGDAGTDGATDGASSDASSDAALDAAVDTGTTADAGVDASTDAQVDTGSPADAASDAAVTDSATQDASVDASSDGATACTAFSDTASLVTLVNVAQNLPAFTGGTITDGIYHLTEVRTYTGTGGATGSSQGVYSQTQRFAGNLYEGVVTVGANTVSFSATYTQVAEALTFTKTCGTLNAAGSLVTVVSTNEIHLKAGTNSMQVLMRQ